MQQKTPFCMAQVYDISSEIETSGVAAEYRKMGFIIVENRGNKPVKAVLYDLEDKLEWVPLGNF